MMENRPDLPMCPTCGREATGDQSAAVIREALATPPADPRDGPACWHCEHPEAHDDD